MRNSNLYLSDSSYHEALLRIKELIARGEELVTEDSEQIGNKYTHCNWGLCTRNWPTKDLLFGRSEKYRQKGQDCPMDKNPEKGPSGCFFRCRVFQNGLKSKDEALKLYDLTIKGTNV